MKCAFWSRRAPNLRSKHRLARLNAYARSSRIASAFQPTSGWCRAAHSRALPARPNTFAIYAKPWCSFRRKRTKACDRAECVLASHHFDDLVVVPGVFGFLRGLDLHHVHIVDHEAIGADVSAL